MTYQQAIWANFLLDTDDNERYASASSSFPRIEERGSRQTRMAQKDPGAWDTIVQAIPCGCLVLDRQGLIRAANSLALDLLAVEASQCLDHPLLEAIASWQDTPFAKALPLVLANHTTDGTAEFELPGPHERWLRACVSPLPTPHGQPEAFVVIVDEITELVRLRQRLRWAEYQASIGKLARGIAHELNNPLDGVLRYTHLALEQLTEETPLREYLIHVKEGLDRMVKAVRAFLEFSRQASLPVNRMADLNRLIEDTLLLVQHRAKFQQIRIITQFGPALPPVLDGGIQHAVVNLLKNAFDAMPRGGTLTIATRQNHASVELDIEDTGSGIPEEIRARIFEPFFSTKPIHQGSGLGLVIAKEVVERSGGSIEFTSRVGIGTTFRISVPVAPPEARVTQHGS